MADVFLIALYIVMVKGVGIGHVASAWGLWLFTFCVRGLDLGLVAHRPPPETGGPPQSTSS